MMILNVGRHNCLIYEGNKAQILKGRDLDTCEKIANYIVRKRRMQTDKYPVLIYGAFTNSSVYQSMLEERGVESEIINYSDKIIEF